VLARFGPSPPSRCSYRQPPLDDAAVREITQHLQASVAQKRAAGLLYLAAEPWDLFAVGFREAHCGGHAFWDLEPGHPAHNPARRGRLGDPILTVLHAIDAAVAELVAAAGSAAQVAAFTPSAYQPNGSLDHLMPGVVARLAARRIALLWGWRKHRPTAGSTGTQYPEAAGRRRPENNAVSPTLFVGHF